MIKKVKTEQLKPGMFIHDLNCGWMYHPFLMNSLKINDEKTIEKMVKHRIREVYIDTDKGLDIEDALTKEDARRDITAEIENTVKTEIIADDTVSVQEELVRAKEVKKEALKTVRSLMEDIKFGRQIDKEKIDPVVEKMVDSILRNKNALTSLSRIKKVDEYTFMHSVSVGALMISFGKHLGFDYELLKSIGIGGLLHDIGKTKVPVEILTKKGKLSEDEFVRVKEHVKHSRNILEKIAGIDESSISVAAHHHERIDGTGYPSNLKGDEISKFGQMTAIVDVYDAMTSKRCYQLEYQPTEVLKNLFEWNNTYNGEMVQEFIRCIGIYPIGTLVCLESGLIGVVLNQGKKSLLHPIVRIVYNKVKKQHVMPYDIDLSIDRGERIGGYEVPEKWDIRHLSPKGEYLPE